MSIPVWRIGWNGALDLAALPNGSLLADGRWHVAAHRMPIVYAGATRALCQLEKRVHCNGFAPRNMALLRLELPADSPIEDARKLGLHAKWKNDMSYSQAVGAAWAMANSSLGLWVPSFLEPAESNLLINPRHARYKAIKVHVEKNPFVFDPRLFA